MEGLFFNHGWTQMNTDSENEMGAESAEMGPKKAQGRRSERGTALAVQSLGWLMKGAG